MKNGLYMTAENYIFVFIKSFTKIIDRKIDFFPPIESFTVRPEMLRK